MEHLPKLEFNEKREPEFYHANVPHRYTAFLERMRELLIGDCFAITVDNEVVYNRIAPKTVRERILDMSVRAEFVNNPHVIFSSLFEKYQNAVVKFYLYAETPWFVYIMYNPDTEIFNVSYYKSVQYMNRYD